ncbi:hypothetical protein PIB30_093035 [Stylosanthes scabra]|uniref:Uncharacterized protein n=1 Tax=Stylosanthes scabra TaxID=79078 RepID=A0ABU6YWW9_9FABA|nr:hypothetical protein [Stylosanthes scabra]
MLTNILTEGPPVRAYMSDNPTTHSRNRLNIVGSALATPITLTSPQLQEDNTIASTHNFYDSTTIPPYNRQYYTQGGRDGQPARWIPPQQPQAQPRQPYTYSQPQNSQNPRYQPPHNQ